jgi:uncharacterized membrane protein
LIPSLAERHNGTIEEAVGCKVSFGDGLQQLFVEPRKGSKRPIVLPVETHIVPPIATEIQAMARTNFSRTVAIPAPLPLVWSVMANVERWPEWTASISRVRFLSPLPLQVGSRIRIHQPKLPPAVWRVTELLPGASFTWISRAPGMRVTARHVAQPFAAGTRVTLSIQYAGFLGALFARWTAHLNEHYLNMEAEGLKMHCTQLLANSDPARCEWQGTADRCEEAATKMTAIDFAAQAQEWIAAWNAHDLDRILAHYSEDVELVSPLIATITGRSDGSVRGKPALREYFKRGLQTFPTLHFQFVRVYPGVRSCVLEYRSVRGLRSAEFMEFDEHGRVQRVRAHYSDDSAA